MSDSLRFDKRQEDKCWIKRLYFKYTPHVQMMGWLFVVVPILYTCFAFYGDVQANSDMRKDYYNFKDNMLQLSQEVHDIHEQLVPHR